MFSAVPQRPAPVRAPREPDPARIEHPYTDEVRRLRALAILSDSAITVPGTGIRLGLDPILGLIPGIGDAMSGLLSAYIVLRSANLGSRRSTLAVMIFNVLVDTAIGSIPLAGDLFDVAWKANSKNVALLETELERNRLAGRSFSESRRLVGTMSAAIIVLLMVALAAATILLLRLLVKAIFPAG